MSRARRREGALHERLLAGHVESLLLGPGGRALGGIRCPNGCRTGLALEGSARVVCYTCGAFMYLHGQGRVRP